MTAREQVENCIESIAGWQPIVNAMMAMDVEAARRQADAADKAAAEGRWLGLLHGLPMVIKDNLDTAGLETTSGSLFFKGNVPNADAPTVARLRQAGAVIIGKVTMHEFAFGIRSYNPVIGQARNPYDASRVPGGSSGGSGIAVAAGMATAALGTDTGGSVRLPASICGITGLRPTSGRISNRGCMPVSIQHDTVGPMARTALDCARIFAVLAGYDAADPTSVDQPLENFLPSLGEGIAGVRIGVPRNHYLEGCAPDVLAGYKAALSVLERLGARLVDVTVEGAGGIQDEAAVMIYSDACHLHADRLEKPELWGPMTIERMRVGLGYSGRDYARAMRAKEAWKRTLANLFGEIDILATPALHEDPPLIEDGRNLQGSTLSVTKNTYCGAFGNIPGISLPCGLSKAGMPMGLQLEAAWWREPLLLRAGHTFQMATQWHEMRPRRPA